MARKKKKNHNFAPEKRYPGLALIEPTLFDEEEGTFTDNNRRRRVYVHLVPAPWSRVVALSLIYAFGVTVVQEIWVALFGRPEWHLVDTKSVKMADKEPGKIHP